MKTGDLCDGELLDIPESITPLGLANSSAKRLPPGTLLIAMYGATIGRLGLLTFEAATNQACAALLPQGETAEVIPYVFQYLLSQRDELRRIGQGGAQPNISQAILKDYRVPLPPLKEQRRIVAKLEALQARSRRAREAMEAVPPLLEKLRQSILAAAFRGDLTRDWRAKHPDVEPASKLLTRIRAERRAAWEKAELAKLKAKGKAPTDDRWTAKYVEPEPSDTTGLPALPGTWRWMAVDELCPGDAPAVYGIILPGDHVPDGVPYVRPIDVAEDGGIELESLRRTTPEIAEQYQRAALRSGDVVLSIVGTIGKVLVVPDELEGGNITQSSARIRPPSQLPSEYVAFALRSPLLTQQYDKYRFGNAVQRLNVEHVRRLAVPVCPREEALMIVARVTKLMASASATQVQALLSSLARLDAAVLAKAFRGELVPHDPNDEPADAMLARLRRSLDDNSAQRDREPQRNRGSRGARQASRR